MKSRIRKGTSSSQRPAMLWKWFFSRLLGEKNASTHPIEAYIAVFSETFHLAKAPYGLGGRILML